MNNKRAVITGMGIVCPTGDNIEDFRTSLLSGKSGICKVDELEKEGFGCTLGGLCKTNLSKIQETFPQLNIPIISRSSLLLIKSAYEALNSAGLLTNNELNISPDLDIVIGSTISSADIWGDAIVKKIDTQNHTRLGSYAFEQIINSSPAAMLSGIFHTTGRVISNSLACASSTESIADAVNQIRYQNKKIVLCGGVDPYSKYYWATMDAMRITNRHNNDQPEKASRPMSSSARGFIPAEGSAVLIIEDFEHAKQRNAKIFAEIIGTHVNSGGQTNGGSMTSSNQSMLIRCITMAINDTGKDYIQLDYISGHLTGTKADVPEIKAWHHVLNAEKNNFPYINSTKSMIGHTMGACGAIETIATVIQMNNNFIHGTLNIEDLNPEISDLIPKEKVPMKKIINVDINYAATANFGFGDVNACLILKKYDE